MAYRDAQGRIQVSHTDCPTEHAMMVKEFLYHAQLAALEAEETEASEGRLRRVQCAMNVRKTSR